MDIDALKATLSSLDSDDHQMSIEAASSARRAQRSLTKLTHWQTFQIVIGIITAVAGGTVWHGSLAQPGPLFACGVIVHLYGVLIIALAIAARVQAMRIDMALPVIETERHMARLRRVMLASGWLLGASWWVLWVPFVAVAVRLSFGFDMLAAFGIAGWIAVATLTGLAGWGGMWLLRGWATSNGRSPLVARLDDVMTGASFRAAQRHLSGITRFVAE